jgi:hypothetical protein
MGGTDPGSTLSLGSMPEPCDIPVPAIVTPPRPSRPGCAETLEV